VKALFNAIYSKWNSSVKDSVSGITCKLYNTEANPDASYPYCVMTIVSDVENGTLTEVIEDNLIQFAVYDDSSTAENVLDIFEAVKSAFDFEDLTVTGYKSIGTDRVGGANLTKITEEGSNYWQLICQYRIRIEEN